MNHYKELCRKVREKAARLPVIEEHTEKWLRLLTGCGLDAIDAEHRIKMFLDMTDAEIRNAIREA